MSDMDNDNDEDCARAAEAQKRWSFPMGGQIDTTPSNLASEKALDDESVGTR